MVLGVSVTNVRALCLLSSLVACAAPSEPGATAPGLIRQLGTTIAAGDTVLLQPGRVGSPLPLDSILVRAADTSALASAGRFMFEGRRPGRQRVEATVDGELSVAFVDVVPSVSVGRWRQLDLGGSGGCGITQDGRLACWGLTWKRSTGHIEISEGHTLARPVFRAGLPAQPRQVAVGSLGGCILVEGGSVYCWGDGFLGAPGIESDVPVRLHAVAVPPATTLVAGGSHSCSLTAAGTAWCWGWNSSGQVGPVVVPRTIEGPQPIALPHAVRQLALGTLHSCALLQDGSVWCWGAAMDRVVEASGVPPLGQPRRVDLPGPATAIGSGSGHSCARLEDEALWCWGRGDYFSMALTGAVLGPTRIATNVAPGDWGLAAAVTCVRTPPAELTCWGDNLASSLEFSTYPGPFRMMLPANIGPLQHSRQSGLCAIDAAGIASCWGGGSFGDGTGRSSRITRDGVPFIRRIAAPVEESSLLRP